MFQSSIREQNLKVKQSKGLGRLERLSDYSSAHLDLCGSIVIPYDLVDSADAETRTVHLRNSAKKKLPNSRTNRRKISKKCIRGNLTYKTRRPKWFDPRRVQPTISMEKGASRGRKHCKGRDTIKCISLRFKYTD